MNLRALSQLEPGEKGSIVRVGGAGSIRRRLLDMGVVSGAVVEMQRVAPMGDPLVIRVKGYDLALRKEEAGNIQVAVTGGLLSNVAAGAVVEIGAIIAGRGLRRRLIDLGLAPGVRVGMVSGGRPGPVVLDVGGSRLALGHGVARKIMVIYPGEVGK